MANPPKTDSNARSGLQPADLKQARRQFFDRLQARFDEVRKGEISPDLTIEESEKLAARIRQRVERNKQVKKHVVAQLDAEIVRDEASIQQLKKQAKEDRKRLDDARKKAKDDQDSKEQDRPLRADVPVTEVPGVGTTFASRLRDRSITTAAQVVELSTDKLAVTLDTSQGRAAEILSRAKALLEKK